MFVNSHIDNIYISNTTVTNNAGTYLFFNDNESVMHFNNSTLYHNQIIGFAGSVNMDVHNLTSEFSRYSNTLMANNGHENVSQVGIGGFLSLGGNYFSEIYEQLPLLPSDVIDFTMQIQLSNLEIIDDFTKIYYPLTASPLID